MNKHTKMKLIFLFTFFALFTGTLHSQGFRNFSTAPQKTQTRTQPETQAQFPAQAQTQSTQTDDSLRFSLWNKKVQPIYQFPFQPKSRLTENDYILIMVDENSTASITANTDLKRTVEYDAELKDFPQYNGLSHLVRSAGITPSVDFSAESRTKGQGRRNRRDRITFRIPARIAWDLGDGTLFIAGRKTMVIHDETTILQISGNVKRSDIKNKMISSSLIHDMNLSYSGSGSLTNNYTKSIWGKILDWIWF